MIYTATFMIDYYINWKSLGTRVKQLWKFLYHYGGKRNVSKVLENFGIKTLALGFIGGFTGDYIKKDFVLQDERTVYRIERKYKNQR